MANITYDDDASRHCLGSKPIHCGQLIDVLTALGWLPGRFELASRKAGNEQNVPMFYTRLPVMKGQRYAIGSVGASISFEITDQHVFRWPAPSARERREQIAAPSPCIEEWGECDECSGSVSPGLKRCNECSAEDQT